MKYRGGMVEGFEEEREEWRHAEERGGALK